MAETEEQELEEIRAERRWTEEETAEAEVGGRGT